MCKTHKKCWKSTRSVSKMEKLLFVLIFLFSILHPIFPTTHFDSSQRYLHVYEDESQVNKPLVIKNTDLDLAEVIYHRNRRDLSSSDRNENSKNITTKVNTQNRNSRFALSVSASKVWKRKKFMRHFNRSGVTSTGTSSIISTLNFLKKFPKRNRKN